jgi:ankyrin repeat protein
MLGSAEFPTIHDWCVQVFCVLYRMAAQSPEVRLFNAARAGNLAEVEALLEVEDIEFDEPVESNETPFTIAFKYRHFEIARILANAGADINRTNDWEGIKMPLLCELTAISQFPMFPEGADPRVGGYSMLHGTANDVREFLRLDRADPNIEDQEGNTPLIHAIRAENLDMVRVLLDAGADVNIGNNNGESPLGIAVHLHNREIFTALLDAGAEIGQNDGDIFLHAIDHDDLFFAQELIRRGADINNLFRKDMPLIHAAVQLSEIPGIRFLLANGANIEQRNEENETPLMVAIEEREPAIIEFLLMHGADVNAITENGRTILENAKNHAYTPAVNALIVRVSAHLRRRHGLRSVKNGRRTRKRRSLRRKSRKAL